MTWGLVSRLTALLAALLVAPFAGASGTPLSAAATTYDTAAYTYDAAALLSVPNAATTEPRGSPLRPEVVSWGTSVAIGGFGVAANTGTALVKYDADFAVGQLTAGGRATASQLDEFGAAQGWVRSQTATGPVKYTDGNGVVRLTIKQGSPRAPGSGGPHVELRNPDGARIDPFGNPVSRTSPGNHTPIVWDW